MTAAFSMDFEEQCQLSREVWRVTGMGLAVREKELELVRTK